MDEPYWPDIDERCGYSGPFTTAEWLWHGVYRNDGDSMTKYIQRVVDAPWIKCSACG